VSGNIRALEALGRAVDRVDALYIKMVRQHDGQLRADYHTRLDALDDVKKEIRKELESNAGS
jgi:hypothetical protein